VIAADIVDDAAFATSAVGVTRAVSIVTDDNGAVAGAATVVVGGGSDGDVATAVAGFASATARVRVVVAVVAAGGALVFVVGGFVVATASIVFGDVSVGESGTSGTGVIGVATVGVSVSCEVVDADSALAESSVDDGDSTWPPMVVAETVDVGCDECATIPVVPVPDAGTDSVPLVGDFSTPIDVVFASPASGEADDVSAWLTDDAELSVPVSAEATP
jgi:hypothetical protein